MRYEISEVGFKNPKTYTSLASALRVAANMVAKNAASPYPAQGSFIFIRTETGIEVASIHAPTSV